MNRPGGAGWFTESGRGFALSLQLRRKLHEERSPYQRIAVYDTVSFGHLLTLDDVTMLTQRDNFIYHEMMTHPALFSHPRPRRVVIVGGGDCGSLREVLRHPEVEQVIQVELDERVTRVAEQYFPELCEANGDARASLRFEHATAWMQRAAADSAEVIVLDTTDPVGQAARLFGAPFYRECARVLRDGGILVAQSESPLLDLELLCNMRRAMHEAGFAAVRNLQFPLCTYPSGWWTATMARRGCDFDGFREQDVRAAAFPTAYYNAEIHRASQCLPEFLCREFGTSDARP